LPKIPADTAAAGSYNNFSNKTNPSSKLCPLASNGDGELAVSVRFNRRGTIITQVIKIIAELESGIHHLLPCDLPVGMAGGTAHQCCEV